MWRVVVAAPRVLPPLRASRAAADARILGTRPNSGAVPKPSIAGVACAAWHPLPDLVCAPFSAAGVPHSLSPPRDRRMTFHGRIWCRAMWFRTRTMQIPRISLGMPPAHTCLVPALCFPLSCTRPSIRALCVSRMTCHGCTRSQMMSFQTRTIQITFILLQAACCRPAQCRPSFVTIVDNNFVQSPTFVSNVASSNRLHRHQLGSLRQETNATQQH